MLKFFFVISFPPCVPSHHTCLTSSGSNVAQSSTAPRDRSTNIEKTYQKGALEQERPNISVVMIEISRTWDTQKVLFWNLGSLMYPFWCRQNGILGMICSPNWIRSQIRIVLTRLPTISIEIVKSQISSPNNNDCQRWI